MLCLIFSDVHGNLPALEQVIKKEKDVEQYINLGDVVNYGPWSNECVELINSLNCLNLIGNHEEYFINGRCDVKNDIVQAFFIKNYSSFEKLELITGLFLLCSTVFYTFEGTFIRSKIPSFVTLNTYLYTSIRTKI